MRLRLLSRLPLTYWVAVGGLALGVLVVTVQGTGLVQTGTCLLASLARGKELAPRKIYYVDVVTSGGVWGLQRGS